MTHSLRSFLSYLLLSFTIANGVLAQQDKLLPNDGADFHYFGETVAISGAGKFVVVGADGDDEYGSNAGAAYIFTREGFKYFQVAKLTASDIQEQDFFGRSVAISTNGIWALVGATGDDDNGSSSGSVYVYVNSGGTWKQQAKLTASDGVGQDNFGEAVGISADGTYALVGAPRTDEGGNDAGSAYVYHRNGNTWTEQAKLTANDSEGGELFGDVLALSADGSYALFGVNNDEDNGMLSGSAYVFSRRASIWAQQTKIVPDDGAIQDFFGRSVSISAGGKFALIGADGDDEVGNSSGSAYVYVRDSTTWSKQTRLNANDGAVGDLFGNAVSLSAKGNYALIGADRDDDGADAAGSAYLFHRNEGTWTEGVKLYAGDPEDNDRFGSAVAISADATHAIVGAFNNDDQGDTSGSVYVFGEHALPVELIDFTARATAHSVFLQWKTASETNNAGFHIEQLVDGQWIDIGYIAGAGTTSDPQSYRYTAPQLDAGHYRFRLKQVDFDGTFTYSPETEVTVGVSGRYDLRLAGAHPVRGRAAWVLTLPVGQTVEVGVYDMLGRRAAVLHAGWVNAETPLRLEWGAHAAAPGVYLVNISGERFHTTQQFVLVR